jgi:16S rRNA (guanine966-N2)-methyltransferase
MRVIAGSAGSLELTYPDGVDIRPTTDRVREALFNALVADVPGSRFLDLYAGAGAVGIEALSRGADSAVFMDRNPACISAIEHNLEFTGLEERAHIVRGELPAGLKDVWQKHGPFDIVFADPPYAIDRASLLEELADCVAGAAALLILECSERNEPEFAGLPQIHRQQIGETVLLWFESA